MRRQVGGGGGVGFFFNDTATTEIYTLSLHDALPISRLSGVALAAVMMAACVAWPATAQDTAVAESEAVEVGWDSTVGWLKLGDALREGDRKSTRLNSSHTVISYAVFCLKKKNKKNILES